MMGPRHKGESHRRLRGGHWRGADQVDSWERVFYAQGRAYAKAQKQRRKK